MTNRNRIKVVLVDDHAMVREGLAQLLNDDGQFTVVGQGGDGTEALALVKALEPDVVILDYTMPVMDGVTAASKIRRQCPRVRIVILTVHENVHYAVKALEAGAEGFVIKSGAFQELAQGIRAVRAGKVYVSPAISEKMIASLSGGKVHSGLNALSRREFELMRLLGSGRRLQDCAKLMRITESAASTYRSRMLKKLRLGNTAELIRFALENGIAG